MKGAGNFLGPVLCSLPILSRGALLCRRKYPKNDPATRLAERINVKVDRIFWSTQVLKAVSLVVW